MFLPSVGRSLFSWRVSFHLLRSFGKKLCVCDLAVVVFVRCDLPMRSTLARWMLPHKSSNRFKTHTPSYSHTHTHTHTDRHRHRAILLYYFYLNHSVLRSMRFFLALLLLWWWVDCCCCCGCCFVKQSNSASNIKQFFRCFRVSVRRFVGRWRRWWCVVCAQFGALNFCTTQGRTDQQHWHNHKH